MVHYDRYHGDTLWSIDGSTKQLMHMQIFSIRGISSAFKLSTKEQHQLAEQQPLTFW